MLIGCSNAFAEDLSIGFDMFVPGRTYLLAHNDRYDNLVLVMNRQPLCSQQQTMDTAIGKEQLSSKKTLPWEEVQTLR